MVVKSMKSPKYDEPLSFWDDTFIWKANEKLSFVQISTSDL